MGAVSEYTLPLESKLESKPKIQPIVELSSEIKRLISAAVTGPASENVELQQAEVKQLRDQLLRRMYPKVLPQQIEEVFTAMEECLATTDSEEVLANRLDQKISQSVRNMLIDAMAHKTLEHIRFYHPDEPKELVKELETMVAHLYGNQARNAPEVFTQLQAWFTRNQKELKRNQFHYTCVDGTSVHCYPSLWNFTKQASEYRASTDNG